MKILDVPQSGSVAGVTSSRNRYGQYRRTRAIPVNPNTIYQNEVRSNLAASAVTWRSLTDAQRTAWSDYAAGHPRTDSLGQTIFLTGFQSFVGINNTLRLLGEPVISDPPGEPLILEIVFNSMNSAAGVINVNVTGIVAANAVLVFSSPPKSAGVSFNRDYRFIGTLPAKALAPAADVDLTTLFTAKFGDLASSDGKKFFCRFVPQASGVSQPPHDLTVVYTN